MPSPEDTQRRHAGYVNQLTASFKDALERIVQRVTRRIVGMLGPELDMDAKRRVLPTAGNLQALRRLDKLFLNELDAAGYKSLLNAFTSQFTTGSFPFYNEVLDSITERLKQPLPKLKFSTSFKGFMASQQTQAQKTLRNLVENAGRTAMNRASTAVGAVPFEELVEILAKAYKLSIGQSETLARTSLVTFWRSLMAETYRQIEEDLPAGAVAYYRYVGPRDRLTREFCRKHTGKVRTRAEWEALDNRQMPNPFLTAGGWNCRHHLVLDHITYSRASVSRG